VSADHSLDVSWPTDWLRAALGLCTLQILDAQPTYGYAIIAELARVGLGEVKGGTLYPLLTRFEAAGWLEVEWRPGEGGPGRKYFALTALGRSELARQRVDWRSFTRITTNFLSHSHQTESGQ
jgi:PadR family transcriptional regulator PadR